MNRSQLISAARAMSTKPPEFAYNSPDARWLSRQLFARLAGHALGVLIIAVWLTGILALVTWAPLVKGAGVDAGHALSKAPYANLAGTWPAALMGFALQALGFGVFALLAITVFFGAELAHNGHLRAPLMRCGSLICAVLLSAVAAFLCAELFSALSAWFAGTPGASDPPAFDTQFPPLPRPDAAADYGPGGQVGASVGALVLVFGADLGARSLAGLHFLVLLAWVLAAATLAHACGFRLRSSLARLCQRLGELGDGAQAGPGRARQTLRASVDLGAGLNAPEDPADDDEQHAARAIASAQEPEPSLPLPAALRPRGGKHETLTGAQDATPPHRASGAAPLGSQEHFEPAAAPGSQPPTAGAQLAMKNACAARAPQCAPTPAAGQRTPGAMQLANAAPATQPALALQPSASRPGPEASTPSDTCVAPRMSAQGGTFVEGGTCAEAGTSVGMSGPATVSLTGPSTPSRFDLLDPAAPTGARAQLPSNVIKGQIALLEQALHHYGVRCRLTVAQAGPVLTRYAAHCDKQPNIARVLALVDEITEASGVASLRIIPVTRPPHPDQPAAALAERTGHSEQMGRMGHGGQTPAFGIEVVNAAPEPLLRTRTLHAIKPFQHPGLQLPFALGLDPMLQPHLLDLAERSLIACIAPPASGAAVLQNALLGIVLRCEPADVQAICIDPGLASLDPFAGVPHVFGPPLHSAQQIADALAGVVAEIRARHQVMTQARAATLRALNNQIRHSLARDMPLKRRVRIGFDPVTRQPLEQELLLASEPFPRVLVAVAGLERIAAIVGGPLLAALDLVQELGARTGVHMVVTAAPGGPGPQDAALYQRLNRAGTLMVGQLPQARDSAAILGFAGAERLLPVGDYIIRDASLKAARAGQRTAPRRRYLRASEPAAMPDFADAFDLRVMLPAPTPTELARVCGAFTQPDRDVA